MVVVSKRAGAESSLERLVSAAELAIIEHGVDGITVAGLATSAGVSRPTVYAYFGDVGGAAAEVWLRHGPAWLSRLLDSAAFPPSADLPTDAMMAELVLAAARIDELREALAPDLSEVWEKTGVLGEIALVRSAWRLGCAIGAEACRPVMPLVEMCRPIVSWLDDLADSSRDIVLSPDLASNPTPQVDLSRPVPPGDDPLRTLLLEASMRVVANAGVAKASMLRICRAARVSTGVGWPRFDSAESLVIDGFAHAIDAVIRDNLDAAGRVTEDLPILDRFAAFIPWGLAPARSQWRRYRQELYLASLHNDRIRREVAHQLRRADEQLRQSLVARGINEVFVDGALTLNQAMTVGFAALHELGLPVGDVDHRLALRWIGRRGGY